MPKSVITLREAPLIIDTAHGPIIINRVNDGRRRQGRKLEIITPEGVRAKIGVEQLKEKSEWVEFVDGSAQPLHRYLEYVQGDNGLILSPAREARLRIG